MEKQISITLGRLEYSSVCETSGALGWPRPLADLAPPTPRLQVSRALRRVEHELRFDSEAARGTHDFYFHGKLLTFYFIVNYRKVV
ncbi:unnamed protein product [Pleuronectes platessa]|uniref:Uncharacterized protein n=1 Tax=Pleuronectes platessa TaxID=8262 RepID=A0A9N7UM25_PLEPL|nr:unnamed protein product [Pleuronectes platessa]